MLCFETCPICSGSFSTNIEHLKPMVLSGDDKEMQCVICGHKFILPDCEDIKKVARRQREKRYA